MSRDHAYLLHIRDAIQELMAYHAEGRAAFDASYRTQLASERLLGIIGEAAARLSSGVRDSADSVPWKRIIGMRNILVHGYFNVDHDIVWAVIDKELPGLLHVTLELLETARE